MNLSALDPLALTALGAVIAYLIGSLSFAVIISRLFGLADPRSYGSGNPGATNVLRSGNKGAAILTLLFDAVKGYIPVVVAQHLGCDAMTITVVGLAAFLGHLWPVFFKFEGGKGVATAAGVLLGFAPVIEYLGWGAGPMTLGVALMSALLIWRHEANIRKLLAGQESKLGQKAA
jgi:glycerol-3-phosphate acyltransferase PlsY